METLKKADLEFFESLLTRQLEELLVRGKQTFFDTMTSDNAYADPLDRAATESENRNRLRIRSRESRLIKKIKTALDKIENGEFGICETCGEDIPMNRLHARPVTAFCIECKTKMESWEKAAGY